PNLPNTTFLSCINIAFKHRGKTDCTLVRGKKEEDDDYMDPRDSLSDTTVGRTPTPQKNPLQGSFPSSLLLSKPKNQSLRYYLTSRESLNSKLYPTNLIANPAYASLTLCVLRS
ncbi:ATP-dependent RNA helicase has1, partial [Striga asiatica]